VAILYHSGRVLISPSDETLGILTRDAFETPRVIPKVLAIIEAFAISKAIRAVEDPLDRDIDAPEPEPQLYDVSQILTQSSKRVLTAIPSRRSESPSNSCSDEEVEHRYNGLSTNEAVPCIRHTSNVRSDTSESDITELEESDAKEIASKEKRKRHGIPAVCRGVLWVINTTGCVRGAFLLQFDELSLARLRLDVTSTSPLPCCDRHTDVSDDAIPEALRRLLPPSDEIASQTPPASDHANPDLVNHEDNFIDDIRSVHTVTRRGGASWAKKDAIFDVLHNLRETVWQETARYGIYTPYTASVLLPDDIILAIARKCDTVASAEDVDAVLAQTQHAGKPRPLGEIDSQRIYTTLLKAKVLQTHKANDDRMWLRMHRYMVTEGGEDHTRSQAWWPLYLIERQNELRA